MSIGLVGQKCGMTRIFTPEGESIPVTVIKVEPNRIVQMKNEEHDGYLAVQVTCGSKKTSRINKPEAGHFAKANVLAGDGLWEFALENKEGEGLAVGSELKIDVFKEGQKVDIQGITKGKGFAGVIKRHHFSGQDRSHGNSLSHRAPGSIGQRQTPGRVFRGKKMAGHLGDATRTIQNQEIVKIDPAKGLLLVRGVVPGATGGMILVKPTVKNKKQR
jgi:large subunit ribosomal protein L3